LEDRQNASWSNGFTELVGKSSLLDSVLQHFDDVSGHAGRAVDTTPQTHGQVDAEFERGWNTFESRVCNVVENGQDLEGTISKTGRGFASASSNGVNVAAHHGSNSGSTTVERNRAQLCTGQFAELNGRNGGCRGRTSVTNGHGLGLGGF